MCVSMSQHRYVVRCMPALMHGRLEWVRAHGRVATTAWDSTSRGTRSARGGQASEPFQTAAFHSLSIYVSLLRFTSACAHRAGARSIWRVLPPSALGYAWIDGRLRVLRLGPRLRPGADRRPLHATTPQPRFGASRRRPEHSGCASAASWVPAASRGKGGHAWWRAAHAGPRQRAAPAQHRTNRCTCLGGSRRVPA